MNYEDLDDYGKALADAYHAATADLDKAVINALFGAHTNSGGNGPPPPHP